MPWRKTVWEMKKIRGCLQELLWSEKALQRSYYLNRDLKVLGRSPGCLGQSSPGRGTQDCSVLESGALGADFSVVVFDDFN